MLTILWHIFRYQPTILYVKRFRTRTLLVVYPKNCSHTRSAWLAYGSLTLLIVIQLFIHLCLLLFSRSMTYNIFLNPHFFAVSGSISVFTNIELSPVVFKLSLQV